MLFRSFCVIGLVALSLTPLRAAQERLMLEADAHTTVRQFSHEGLPSLAIFFDSRSRPVEIQVNGRAILEYSYNAHGARELRTEGGWRLAVTGRRTGRLTQTLHYPDGGVARYTSHKEVGDVVTIQPVLLNAVRNELGLAEDWPRDVVVKTRNRTRTVIDRGGHVIATIAPTNEYLSVGVDERGEPLMWEVALAEAMPEGTLVQGLPSRLVVGRDGSWEVALFAPVRHAFYSMGMHVDGEGHPDRFMMLAHVDDPLQTKGLSTDSLEICGWGDMMVCGPNPYGGDGTYNEYCTVRSVPIYCYGEGSGGGSWDAPDPELEEPPGGGGAPQIQELVNMYSEIDCREHGLTNPGAADFVNASTYSDPGYFPFGEMRDDSYNWAVLTDALLSGLMATRNQYGSAMNVTSGYRAPTSRPTGSANCSGHFFGTAADISMRNASGQRDCAIWDALAAAGHAAGAWVEPWEELVERDTANHVHLQWGREPNSDYGTCVPSQVQP